MNEQEKQEAEDVALYGLFPLIANRAGLIEHFSHMRPIWADLKIPFLGTPCPATRLRVLPSGLGEYDLFKLRPMKARRRKKA